MDIRELEKLHFSKTRKRNRVILFLVLLSFLSAGFCTFWLVNESDDYLSYKESINNLRTSIYSVNSYLDLALAGNNEAFYWLKFHKDKINDNLNAFNRDTNTKFSSISFNDNAKSFYKSLVDIWATISKNLEIINNNQTDLIEMKKTLDSLNKSSQNLKTRYEAVLKNPSAFGFTDKDAIDIAYLVINNERSMKILFQVLKDYNRASDVLQAFQEGLDFNQAQLQKIKQNYTPNKTDKLQAAPDFNFFSLLNDEQAFLDSLSAVDSKITVAITSALAEAVISKNTERLTKEEIPGLDKFVQDGLKFKFHISFAGLLVSLFIIAVAPLLSFYDNFKALKKLLDSLQVDELSNKIEFQKFVQELALIGDGQLAFSIQAKQHLLKMVSEALDHMKQNFRAVIQRLSSDLQNVIKMGQGLQLSNQSIEQSTNQEMGFLQEVQTAIKSLSDTVKYLRTDASSAARVAGNSLDLAQKASSALQEAQSGMERMREQIQETSKRVKRLGESSQEISDTVTVIEDIAEQTNILALNAAIQAATAGEGGRGFSVVADEIQRLAERASRATKEISTLVKSVQSDTQQTVIAMEHTTLEVVQGTHSTQSASSTLSEMASILKQLSEVIYNINYASEQQEDSTRKLGQGYQSIDNLVIHNAQAITQTLTTIVMLLNQLGGLEQGLNYFKTGK